jgi:ferredoxin--NADP+ reductase
MTGEQVYPLGSKDRPLRVAIVGSGPAGFYAADALLRRKDLTVHIDLYDRLPTPYGLVRFGVAPDHQKIKGVIRVYERIAASQNFRFFGNVNFGSHLSVEELRKHYDQIVYAVGCQTDRRLDIPGEDLEGSHTATEFVAWYNSHPDYIGRSFDLSQKSAAVVGVGNVAMDVTRILVKDHDELLSTDIAGYALEALRKSQVEEVVILARRGPKQAAFSLNEIKEIASLKGVDVVVDPKEVELDEASKASEGKEGRQKVEYLTEISQAGEGSQGRKVRLRFCVSPLEILGEDGRVTAVKIEKNELYADETGYIRSRGTGQYEVLPVGLIFRSIGYRGVPLPGVPFNEKRGTICNQEGRVTDSGPDQIVPGEYAVGWAKRGPTGLIGTNKRDSAATVEKMLEDIEGKSAKVDPEKTPEAVDRMLAGKKLQVVTFEDWKILDHQEVEAGKRLGKVREKLLTVSAMLEAIEKG